MVTNTIAVIPWSKVYAGEALFNLNSQLNRDNSLLFWHEFRLRAKSCGWSVVSIYDVTESCTADVFIVLDPRPAVLEAMSAQQRNCSIVLFSEPPVVQPENFSEPNLLKLKSCAGSVYCFSPQISNQYGFNEVAWYVDLYPQREQFTSIQKRDGVCMIAQRKARERPQHEGSLLELRSSIPASIVNEKSLSGQFQLYGGGWLNRVGLLTDIAPNWLLNSRIGRSLISRLENALPRDRTLERVYMGKVASKSQPLSSSEFCLIMENMRFEGYITEKIFDALQFSCIPIYYGAPDVSRLLPKEIFINGDEFSDPISALKFATSMEESKREHMRILGKEWLRSEAFIAQFGREARIKTLLGSAGELVSKLGRAN